MFYYNLKHRRIIQTRIYKEIPNLTVKISLRAGENLLTFMQFYLCLNYSVGQQRDFSFSGEKDEYKNQAKSKWS